MKTIRKNILIGHMIGFHRLYHDVVTSDGWRRLDSINRVFFRKLGQEATSHLAKHIGALQMVGF